MVEALRVTESHGRVWGTMTDTINEQIAMRSTPRSYEQVVATLDAYRRERDELRKMAGELAAFNTPPIFVDGDTLRPTEFELPDKLRQALIDNAETIAGLELELRDARERYVYARERDEYGIKR